MSDREQTGDDDHGAAAERRQHAGTRHGVEHGGHGRQRGLVGDGQVVATGDDDHGLAIQEARPKLKRPPLYKVILLNDDYTPMEFVVQVLEHFFSMNREKATQVMLHVHTRGVGVCGVYTKDVAETKVAQVNDFARSHQHPLLCAMEEA